MRFGSLIFCHEYTELKTEINKNDMMNTTKTTRDWHRL